MILLISVLILLLVITLTIKLYIIPLRKVQKLVEDFRKKGYKVKTFKFTLLNYALGQEMQKNNLRLEFLKHDYCDYDIAIGNIITGVFAIPINPTLIKECYHNSKNLIKSQFDFEIYGKINGGGLVFAQGQVHKKKRKIISQVFNYDFLMEVIPYVLDTFNEKFQQIDSQIGKPIKTRQLFSVILSEIIGKVFFGVNMNTILIKDKKYCQSLNDFAFSLSSYIYSGQHFILGDKGYKYSITKAGKGLKQHYQILKAQAQIVLQKKIADYMESKNVNKIPNQGQKVQKNLITSLIQNNLLDAFTATEQEKYSFYEIIGQFFIFFSAGTDTTTCILSVILFALYQNPKVLEKLRQQVDLVIKDDSSYVKQNLKKLVYTDAVIHQALRMYGPAAFSFIRQVKSDFIEIGEVKIPKNYIINFISIINHYSSKYFTDPEQFRPERWLSQTQQFVLPTSDPFVFLPFGAGQRSCIGQHFTKLEQKIIVTKIVKFYDFKPLGGVDMKLNFIYFNVNEDVIFTKRTQK